MQNALDERLKTEIDGFKRDGILKRLLEMQSPQAPRVRMAGRGEINVLSSNNNLGLSAVPEVIEAGRAALTRLGAGTGSVRFICGTFDVHNELERELASFLRFERALTYVSCWNANTGLMATVLDEPDALISDELNHASIIDGARLCKAQRHRYRHSDMTDLERILQGTASARHRFVITDGVFSMEGDDARLPDLVALCEKHKATLAVDDSHATGVLGKTGRGTPEHFGLEGRIDILVVPVSAKTKSKNPVAGLSDIVRTIEPHVVIPMLHDEKFRSAVRKELGTDGEKLPKLAVAAKDIPEEGFRVVFLEAQ